MFGKCTIYFEDPFWVGVFERTEESGYTVARYVFGAEPGQAEILSFAHSQFHLLKFSQVKSAAIITKKVESYKHRQHRIRHEATQTGVGTQAQQVIKAEYERSGQLARSQRKELQQQADDKKFLMKAARRMKKQRGH